MLIRKEIRVTKMQSKKATHDTKSDGIQTACPIGATSLTNASDKPSAPLENVRRYLSKFSVADLVFYHNFCRYSSCNSSALVFSAMLSTAPFALAHWTMKTPRIAGRSLIRLRATTVLVQGSKLVSSPRNGGRVASKPNVSTFPTSRFREPASDSRTSNVIFAPLP